MYNSDDENFCWKVYCPFLLQRESNGVKQENFIWKQTTSKEERLQQKMNVFVET